MSFDTRSVGPFLAVERNGSARCFSGDEELILPVIMALVAGLIIGFAFGYGFEQPCHAAGIVELAAAGSEAALSRLL